MNESISMPVFISHRKTTGYRVSSLFIAQLHASALRYDRAQQRLRQAVHDHFGSIKSAAVSRKTLDERIWLGFSPDDLHFERIPLGFESGSRWIEGLFAVAFFTVDKRRYGCLPMFDCWVVDLGDASLSREERNEHLVAHIMAFFRKQRKDLGSAFDPHPYLALANDEIGTMDLSVPLIQGRFPFEEPNAFLAKLFDDLGDGSQEIQRVATDLHSRFPDDLLTAVEREAEIAQLHDYLHNADRTPLVLVGPSGAGKTTMLHGAIRLSLRDHSGRDLHRIPKVWQLDPLRVISGMSQIGQWQRRMEIVLQHVRHRMREQYRLNQPDHLYCDNLVALTTIGRSAQNSLTLADVLRPHLEKGAFKMIAEATPQAWQTLQQRDRRFADLFRVVRVDAPSRDAALRMMLWRRAELELQHECTFEVAGITELLKLNARFAGQHVLPGSAVKTLERLAVRHAKGKVGTAEVVAAYSANYHFREVMFSRQLGLNIEDIRTRLTQQLVGQAAARECLVEVVALIKSGLAAPGKPLASLLFIGPTGVGKSEAAKLLADTLFDDAGGLLRFDMNEYVDSSAAERLIGGPNLADGQLTTAVRQRMACVLLLDEFEKAHPDVHDLFLQVLGEGRLTDAMGRTTDFSQCVIILTSNLGAAAASRTTGFAPNPQDAKHSYREAVERFFRPEFVNRVDQVVNFSALELTDMLGIAQLQLQRILSRDGFVRRMSFLNVTPSALQNLAHLGHDPSLGARALKRGIERSLTGPLAQSLATSATSSPMVLNVDCADGELRTTATVLSQVSAVSWSLPSHANTLADYEYLSGLAEALNGKIRHLIDEGPEGDIDQGGAKAFEHCLRAMLVQLDPIRETLSERCWDLRQPKIEANSRLAHSNPRGGKAHMIHGWQSAKSRLLESMCSQHDMQEFLHQVHATASTAAGAGMESVELRLQISVLERRFNALIGHGIEQVLVSLDALQGGNDDVLEAAWNDYAPWLGALDAHVCTHALVTPLTVKGRASGRLVRSYEGVGLRDFFAHQCGIHLWYQGNQAQAVPLALRVWTAQDSGPPPMPTEIVRLRKQATSPAEVNSWTDLRSALVRQWGFGSQDHPTTKSVYWLLWSGAC